MTAKQSKWLDELKRFKPTDTQQPREEKAYLGYRKVSPDEKAEYVLRHFNRVARRYDLMNTLLSFGIHYLWKGTAVNMLDLKSGGSGVGCVRRYR